MLNITGKNYDIGGEVTTENILKDIIESDQLSVEKYEMKKGVNYYNSRNDIRDRDFREYYVDSVKHIDYNKSNDMIVNNLHKKLVDQKKGYISSKKIVIDSEDKELAEKVNDLLGEKWHDTVQEWIQGASNKGKESIQPFITESGEFDYCIIPAEQVIYITDTTYQKKVVQSIRYYVMEWVVNGEVQKVIRAEVWDDEKVTRYQEIDNGFGEKEYQFIQPFTNGITNNPEYHWYTYNTNFTDASQLNSFNEVNKTGIEQNGWGRVPILNLKNNTEERSDLIPYKGYIDALDIVSSGFLNDLKDIQLAIWVLRGYEGDSLSDFMLNLQKFKAISLDNDDSASAEPKTIEIPKEARIELMKWLERKIYEVGQGVDEAALSGGSLTNVAIKAAYSGLKLKSDALITKLRTSLQEFMYFAVKYINDRDNTDYDYKTITFTFNTSMIFNENEILTILKDMGVKVSQRTLLANVPFIDDVDKELALLEEEQKEFEKSLGAGMGFEGDE